MVVATYLFLSADLYDPIPVTSGKSIHTTKVDGIPATMVKNTVATRSKGTCISYHKWEFNQLPSRYQVISCTKDKDVPATKDKAVLATTYMCITATKVNGIPPTKGKGNHFFLFESLDLASIHKHCVLSSFSSKWLSLFDQSVLPV